MKHLKLFESYFVYETVLVIGLPGSGKSTLANRLKLKNPDKDFFIVDDDEYHKAANMFGKNNMILCDGYLIDRYFFNAVMSDFKKNGIKFSCLYFENAPEKCVENIKSRKNHSMPTGTLLGELSYYSKDYSIIIQELRNLQKDGTCLSLEEVPIYQV